MTPEQQIKALAELDGKWRGMKEYEDDYAYIRSHGEVQSLWGMICKKLPYYLTSYNAIIPLIQKQPLELRLKMTAGHKISFMVTPSQLCEALLRETGKWIE